MDPFKQKLEQTTKEFFSKIDSFKLQMLTQKVNDMNGSYSKNDIGFQIYLLCENLNIDTAFLDTDQIILKLEIKKTHKK